MATCRLVYLYVLLNIFIIPSVEIAIRNICLDKALSFATMYDYNSWSWCKTFTESNALTFFGEGSTSCNTACHINLHFNYMYQYEYMYKLGFVSILFESYNYSANTGCNNEAELHIDCSNYRKEQLGIFFNGICKERNAKCSKWNYFCVCLCDQGYLMYHGHCIRAHLSLNMSCVVNDQCSGSPYASCRGGRCACIEGYVALNSTDCVLRQHDLKEKSLQTENRESTSDNMGHTLGALFGGLFLGVITSSGTVYLIYRRSLYKRKETAVISVVNATHGDVSDDDTIQNKASTNQNMVKQKKVNNVSPINRSEESPQYSKSLGKQSTVTDKDDVYNHLNEKRETEDENTYDHACAAAGKGHRDLDDYSNLHGMDDDIIVVGGTDIDDYSTIAHN